MYCLQSCLPASFLGWILNLCCWYLVSWIPPSKNVLICLQSSLCPCLLDELYTHSIVLSLATSLALLLLTGFPESGSWTCLITCFAWDHWRTLSSAPCSTCCFQPLWDCAWLMRLLPVQGLSSAPGSPCLWYIPIYTSCFWTYQAPQVAPQIYCTNQAMNFVFLQTLFSLLECIISALQVLCPVTILRG